MKVYYSYIIEHPEIDEWELRLLSRYAPKAKTLLDLGCGMGYFLKRAKRQYQVMGVEQSSEGARASHKKGLKIKQADGQKTGLKADSFDIVRSKNVLEHLEKPERLIAEAKRLLSPKGFLVIHVPTQYSLFYPITNFWDDYTHIRPFSKKGLLRLLGEYGFKIKYFVGYTAGRNWLERILCFFLGKIFPFAWLVIAQNPR